MSRAVMIAAVAAALVWAQSARDRATALFREKKFAEAAAVLEQHLARRPDDLAARLLLGLSHQLAGDLPAAEAVLRAAVEHRPVHPAARFYLARVQYLRGKLGEAEQNADRALQLGEPAARVYNLMGLIRGEQNRPEDALAAYARAIRADPRHFADAYRNSGALLLKLGRAEDAVARLTAALDIDAQSAETFYNRARAYLQLQQRRAAEADLVRALSLADHEPARRLLAQLRSGGIAPAARIAGAGAPPPPIRFRNEAGPAGLAFVLGNHPTPRKHLIETMPGGVAAFDYDGDGWVDLYFTNGASIPSLVKNSPKFWNRLYRNEGGMRFRDVTEAAGVAGAGYSMGAAAADYDNDGDVDLFVAGVNRNLLFRNTGRGAFEEVAARAGIANRTWSVAAGWLDYDRDGRLDLFVVNYVHWSPDFDVFCGDAAAKFRVYCHPRHFEGLPNTLYRNRGDGSFEDVSARAGIAAHIGKGMSLAIADYDGDLFPDVFVTNDTLPNFLFRNRGDGTFEEVAARAGTAWNDDGKAVSSMGADFRDFDNDGLPDLVVTALAGETFPLFHNQGKGFFRDATYPSRLGMLTARRSGWGAGWFDFNNDGWKDLFTANSHVTDNIEAFSSDRYRQPNSVFVNLGNGTFADASPEAGADFQQPAAHRGAAFADFDNDGRVDVAVSALGEPAELWHNVSPEPRHWIAFKLEGTRGNRDGIGAVIRMGTRINHMTTAVGYASSSHTPVHFGLDRAGSVEQVEILWPSGVRQVLRGVRADQVLRFREP